MRPMGFDSGDLRRFRAGLALSEVSQHRVEASGAIIVPEADYEQATSGL